MLLARRSPAPRRAVGPGHGGDRCHGYAPRQDARLADGSFVFDLVAGAEIGDPLAVVAFADTLGDERRGAFTSPTAATSARMIFADLRGVDLQVDHAALAPKCAGFPSRGRRKRMHGGRQVALLIRDVGTWLPCAPMPRFADGRSRGREAQQSRAAGMPRSFRAAPAARLPALPGSPPWPTSPADGGPGRSAVPPRRCVPHQVRARNVTADRGDLFRNGRGGAALLRPW